MTVVISMLRGVNLGSHNRLKMDALRALYESLGLLDVESYVQSGNVVFKTAGRDFAKLAGRIEAGIESSFGIDTDVLLRTAGELRNVVTANPFAQRSGIDPSKLLVDFLAREPSPEAREKLLSVNIEPEELRIHGRELYIYFPNGMARPKLPSGLIDRAVKMPCTGRNWNTVTKLLKMAEALEA
ncbi:MAG TPA: DUF1697 domain-containing protein [Candidatus Acidoferrales bacterium]|jgi:uncharacterized protein (DUF1697 family)|nr:DUF1697 domain-containing protein [Candidatus Acidoferrales bacterium]